MKCRRCGTGEGVRHYLDLAEPDWFCGPCHALAKQMDLIELGHVAMPQGDDLDWAIENGYLEHAHSDRSDAPASRPLGAGDSRTQEVREP